jgi:hypothetical protein
MRRGRTTVKIFLLQGKPVSRKAGVDGGDS